MSRLKTCLGHAQLRFLAWNNWYNTCPYQNNNKNISIHKLKSFYFKCNKIYTCITSLRHLQICNNIYDATCTSLFWCKCMAILKYSIHFDIKNIQIRELLVGWLIVVLEALSHPSICRDSPPLIQKFPPPSFVDHFLLFIPESNKWTPTRVYWSLLSQDELTSPSFWFIVASLHLHLERWPFDQLLSLCCAQISFLPASLGIQTSLEAPPLPSWCL